MGFILSPKRCGYIFIRGAVKLRSKNNLDPSGRFEFFFGQRGEAIGIIIIPIAFFAFSFLKRYTTGRDNFYNFLVKPGWFTGMRVRSEVA
jgi:hypothetical protein